MFSAILCSLATVLCIIMSIFLYKIKDEYAIHYVIFGILCALVALINFGIIK